MNIKNENGVTLVALIVTIVVMVILATIAISASVEDNGVIKQTQEGVISASEREVEEALEVKLLLKEKEEIKDGDFNGVKISELTEIFNGAPENTEGKNVYKITPEGLEKLNIKGDYGKGTTSDYFTVQVELDAERNETKNFEVVYIP